MLGIIRLSALDADVIVDVNAGIVYLENNKGETAKVGVKEWEMLREELRLDDAVDYENGETPMTVYQFNSALDMLLEKERLEAERKRLLAERAKILKNT